jgi:hypothetical protein
LADCICASVKPELILLAARASPIMLPRAWLFVPLFENFRATSSEVLFIFSTDLVSVHLPNRAGSQLEVQVGAGESGEKR